MVLDLMKLKETMVVKIATEHGSTKQVPLNGARTRKRPFAS